MKKIQFILITIHLALLNLTTVAQTLENGKFRGSYQKECSGEIVYFQNYGTKIMEIDNQNAIITLKDPGSENRIFKKINLFPNNKKIIGFKVYFMSDLLFNKDDEMEFILAYEKDNGSTIIDLIKNSNTGSVHIIKRLAEGTGAHDLKIFDTGFYKKVEITLGDSKFNYELSQLNENKKYSKNEFKELKKPYAYIINPFSWESGKIDILIFDNKGDLIRAKRKSCRKPKLAINTKNIPQGKYICRLRNKFGISQTHFFEILN